MKKVKLILVLFIVGKASTQKVLGQDSIPELLVKVSPNPIRIFKQANTFDLAVEKRFTSVLSGQIKTGIYFNSFFNDANKTSVSGNYITLQSNYYLVSRNRHAMYLGLIIGKSEFQEENNLQFQLNATGLRYNKKFIQRNSIYSVSAVIGEREMLIKDLVGLEFYCGIGITQDYQKITPLTHNEESAIRQNVEAFENISLFTGTRTLGNLVFGIRLALYPIRNHNEV